MCFIKMVNLIISHQIFTSLLLGFVQKIDKTIQQKQPADECWLLNSIHHGTLSTRSKLSYSLHISGHVEDITCY